MVGKMPLGEKPWKEKLMWRGRLRWATGQKEQKEIGGGGEPQPQGPLRRRSKLSLSMVDSGEPSEVLKAG